MWMRDEEIYILFRLGKKGGRVDYLAGPQLTPAADSLRRTWSGLAWPQPTRRPGKQLLFRAHGELRSLGKSLKEQEGFCMRFPNRVRTIGQTALARC